MRNKHNNLHLNTEQQKRVEYNHKLIYYLLNKMKLSIDEFYDICAIGLCKASVLWDTHPPKQNISFVTFSCYYMRAEISHYLCCSNLPSKKPEEIVYYQAPLSYKKKDCTYEDFLSDNKKYEEDILTNITIQDFAKNLTDTQNKVLYLSLKGFSNAEIGRQLNTTRSYIGLVKKNIQKKYLEFTKIEKKG